MLGRNQPRNEYSNNNNIENSNQDNIYMKRKRLVSNSPNKQQVERSEPSSAGDNHDKEDDISLQDSMVNSQEVNSSSSPIHTRTSMGGVGGAKKEVEQLVKSLGPNAAEVLSDLPPRSARLKPVDYSLNNQRIIYLEYDRPSKKINSGSGGKDVGRRSSGRYGTRSGRGGGWDTEEEDEVYFPTRPRPYSVNHRYHTRTASVVMNNDSRESEEGLKQEKTTIVEEDDEEEDDGPIVRRTRRNRGSLNVDEEEEEERNAFENNDFAEEDDGDLGPYRLRSRRKLISYSDDRRRGNGDEKKQYQLRPRTEVKNYQVRIPLYGASPKKSERRRPPIHRPRKFEMNSFGRLFGMNNNNVFDDSDDERYSPYKDRKRLASIGTDLRPLNYAQLQTDSIDKILMGNRNNTSNIEALADVDPVLVEDSIDFSSVGGLSSHIKSLKEMVLLPLLYPEMFSKFGITPPRGVLFHGPPGTGKTLVARALANACTTQSQKVAFFMRKGADVLSKWVGESERQLKALFEQARLLQPSIIFFDEMDGLAPVRSAKQDQIHSSIVTTLLALMDGLDSRGQVIVIGATNRLDSIDPALRRPGRFDRELFFPLPDAKARAEIIDIHTRKWDPPLPKDLKDYLADSTQGYGGSDIKALVTEAALKALDRTFPQVYKSEKKLKIELDDLHVNKIDFEKSIKQIVPSSYRWKEVVARHLPRHLKPLLGQYLDSALHLIKSKYPLFTGDAISANVLPPPVYRPRLLITSLLYHNGQSQLCSSLLVGFEHMRVHTLTLSSLHQEGLSLETSLLRFLQEAKRILPAILFIPQISFFWDNASEAVRELLMQFLEFQVQPDDALLLLASIDSNTHQQLSTENEDYMSFFNNTEDVVEIGVASFDQRVDFFQMLLRDEFQFNDVSGLVLQDNGQYVLDLIKFHYKQIDQKDDYLPLNEIEAEEKKLKQLTDDEIKVLYSHDMHVFRKLRMILREFLLEILRGKDYKSLTKGINSVEDYENIVKYDLHDLLDKVETMHYQTLKQFKDDVFQTLESFGALVIARDEYFKTTNVYALADYVDEWTHVLDKSIINECEEAAMRVKRMEKDYERVLESDPNYKPYQLNFFKNFENSNDSLRSSRRLKQIDPETIQDEQLEEVAEDEVTQNPTDDEAEDTIPNVFEMEVEEPNNHQGDLQTDDHQNQEKSPVEQVVEQEENIQEIPEQQQPVVLMQTTQDVPKEQMNVDWLKPATNQEIRITASFFAQHTENFSVDLLEKKKSAVVKQIFLWKCRLIEALHTMIDSSGDFLPSESFYLDDLLKELRQ